MKNIFFFNSMLTPRIITFVYWVMLFSSSLFSVIKISQGQLLSGLGFLLVGCIASRVWCELLMVIFKINENIQKMADK
jgi:hypothetical protein